jgi:hypothetical protein
MAEYPPYNPNFDTNYGNQWSSTAPPPAYGNAPLPGQPGTRYTMKIFIKSHFSEYSTDAEASHQSKSFVVPVYVLCVPSLQI